MNPATTTIDAADAVELAELCDLLAGWLATDPATATSWDRHVGQNGQADELRADLGCLAGVPMGGQEPAR